MVGAALLALRLAVAPAGEEARFELREVAGREARALPVTLSAVLPPGRFRDGELCCVARDGGGGKPAVLAAQVDVRSRHADGSLQHALVTVALDVAARSTQELFLVASPAPPLAGPFVAPETAPIVGVELLDREGRRWSARIARPAVADGAAHPRLAGPLAREVEARATLHDGEEELARLAVIVRWRELAGVAGARVEVVVENCALSGAVPPDDVDFARLVVAAGDEVLADLKDAVVWDRTRFAVRRWVGGAPPHVVARADLGWLEKNGWLPPYDAAHPLAPARADELARKLVASPQNGEVDGAKWECGVPLDPGPIARYMPSTGDRGDIGPIPEWAALALNSRGAYAWDALLAADQNGAGSFPIHVRGPDGAMGVDHVAGRALEKRQARRKCPQVADRAHAPLLGYVTFLMTGEALAEEEFAAQACSCFHDWPHDGRYRYPGSRDFAWSLRTTMLASQLLPDAHPRKAWLRERVTANLADLRATIAASESPLHAWGSGSFQSSGRKSWPCATFWSPWQGTWVAASLWWTDRLLGNTDARFLWEWQAAYFARAFAEVGTTWSAPDGTVVKWVDGRHALAYSFPVSTYVPQVAGGEWKQAPESRRWISSFAEALWWLRVNGDHEFEPGKLPALERGADGVASRAPEAWRPKGAWSPPPPPAAGWTVYAMHWFAAIAAADGLEGAAAIDAAIRPLLAQEIGEPGLRMVPAFAKRE